MYCPSCRNNLFLVSDEGTILRFQCSECNFWLERCEKTGRIDPIKSQYQLRNTKENSHESVRPEWAM